MGSMYIERPYINSHMGLIYIETPYISNHRGPIYIETPYTYKKLLHTWNHL